ncbi:LPS biosynthesis-related glycosyltransferase [Microtetraspora sp. NBRC 13810]|uniref:glycosyltransferase family 9 protein n=1 Tax=Microtetraspora sp. NBRC 13810 TaxID=3030990 RepID=UPI0024A5DEAC|nr:glycosyltransferase family 9 protein [Microtetraspora sp. NBRC 13810]GLW05374.1 LPS biosynthesis-related glycosyltransferase [Microtetraspora sp. NBRC 13810]
MSALVEGVRRIAVLRANAVGDLIVALPALEAVKRAYPSARLTLLGREWHARFLTGRPGPVDEVIALPPVPGVSAPETGQRPPPGLLESLRERRFDLALQMHGGGVSSNPFVRRLGARLTAGLCVPEAERLDRWTPYVFYQHETMRLLEVAALVGGRAGAIEPSVAVTAADRAELARAHGEPPPDLVAVHPGAADPRRRWPAYRFAAVADRLGRPVVVTGTEEERDLVEEVIAEMRRPATPAVDSLSLGGLAALYERCALVIANDTGPRHLAAAVGTPTVGVYWCGNLVTAGPLTRTRHRPLISWTAACPVCGATGLGGDAERCPHDVSWVADVPIGAVLEAARALLGEDHDPRGTRAGDLVC